MRKVRMQRWGTPQVIVGLGVLLLAGSARGRTLNILDKVTWTQRGASAVVTLSLRSKPTFTVYKLTRPDRVVVDLANTSTMRLTSPINVDSWAVGQVALSRFSDARSAITRVVITFRRPGAYDVRSSGNKVVLMVTASAKPPANAAKDHHALDQSRQEAARLRAIVAKLKASNQAAAASERQTLAAARREAARLRMLMQRMKSTKSAASSADRRALARTRMALNRLRSKAARLQVSKSHVQARLAQAKRLAAKAAQQAAQQAARLKASKAQVQARLAQARSQAAKAAQQAARLQASKSQVQARLAQARSQAAKAAQQAARLKASKAQVQARLVQARSQAAKAAQEATRLRQQTNMLRKAEADARERLNAARHEVLRARSEAAQARQEADRLRVQARRLKGSAQETSAKLKWVRAEARAAKFEAKEARAEAVRLQGELNTARLLAKRLHLAARRAIRRARRLKTRGARLAAKAARARWLAARRKASLQQIAGLRAEMRRAKAEATQVKADLAKLRIEARRARADARSYRNESAAAKKRQGVLRMQLSQARKQMQALARQAADTKNTVRSYQRSARVAKRRADALARRLGTLEQEHRDMARQKAVLERQLSQARRHVAAAAEQTAVFKTRLSEVSGRVRAAGAVVAKYRTRLAQARRRGGKAAARVRQALKQAEKQLRRARSEYAKIEQAKKASQGATVEARRNLQRLEQQVTQRIALLKQAKSQANQARGLRDAALQQKRRLETKVSGLVVRYRRLVALSGKEERRQRQLRKAYGSLSRRLKIVRKALAEELSRTAQARKARRRAEQLARQAESDGRTLRRSRGVLATQVQALKRMQADLRHARTQAMQRLAGAGRATRKAAMAQWTRERRRRLNEIKRVRRQLAGLTGAITKQQEALARLARARRHAVRAQESSRRRAEAARRDLDEATGQRKAAEQKVTRLLAELQGIRTQRASELRVKERLVVERRGEERRLARLALQKKKLERQVSGLTRLVRRQRAALGYVRRAQRKTGAQLDRLASRVERLKKERLAEEARRRALLVQNRALVRRLQKVRSQFKLARKARPRKLRIRARVSKVQFRDTGRDHRVTIRMAGPFDYDVRRKGTKVLVRLFGVRLPSRLERSLDTSAFTGPVKMVSAYQERRTRGIVDLLVELKHPARFRVNRGGGALWLDFSKLSRIQSGPTKVAIARRRVGGYRSATRAMAPYRPSTAWRRKYRMGRRWLGPKVDMDFKDADIHNVVRLIGKVWKKNIVVSDDVQGKVTIRMIDVPVGRALDVILKSKNLGLVWEGRNIIRVAKMEDIQKEIQTYQKANQIKRKAMPVVMRVIRVNYGDAAEVAKQLKENVLSARGKVTFNKRTNSIIIRDVVPNIEIAKKLVRTLDTPTPQVVIEARIVEARSTFLREIGIQWGGNLLASPATGMPTGLMFPFTIGAAGGGMDQDTHSGGIIGAGAANPNFAVNLPATVGAGRGGALGLSLGTLGGAVNINLRLSAMEETGHVRIISSPRITTLDNVQAKIEQGVRIPISVVSAQGVNTQFVEANLGLVVTPHVTNDNRVRLKIKVEKNEPDFVNTGARGDPTILKKDAESEMLVKNGDTAVIGGIYTRKTAVAYSKIPWFADIPIIGWLFKKRKQSDDRSEVLIFITPRIVRSTAGGGRR